MTQQTRQLSLLKAGGGSLLAVALVSGAINILTLSGSIFMMEIYDRVLPSRSVPTLVGLILILLVLYLFHWFFETIRSRILVRLGGALDEDLGQRVFRTTISAPLRGKAEGDGQQPQRDLDQVRGFLSGGGPSALFDLPWMPLYLAICFMFHPLIGLTALAGGMLLIVVTIATEILSRNASRAALSAAMARSGIAELSRRNAEAVHALGMAGRLSERWAEANARFMGSQRRMSDVAGALGSASKVMRMLIQSAVLGVGAYLVIDGKVTAGVMIASSILVARAMAPIELAIANWKGFLAARQGWARLRKMLAPREAIVAFSDSPGSETMRLPTPHKALSVEGVSAAPPGRRTLIVHDVAFKLDAGSAVGVIGPSGSGKSSLARVLVGLWAPMWGNVRLDGAALQHWDPEARGRHVGYLPQDVELFDGTVADNIARFDSNADPDAIIAAAMAADVHDLIQRLPEGYKTQIGEDGAALSAGQRQRVALARALYGDPFLIVLDEPNSNLDAEGEQALTQAIRGIRARGGVVVVIAHRPNALVACDYALVMGEGRVLGFGPKDEVLKKALRPVASPPSNAEVSQRLPPAPQLKTVEA